MRTTLYTPTAGDLAIIDRAAVEDNPNVFTNFYLANRKSGTRFKYVSDEQIGILRFDHFKQQALQWQQNYNVLHDIWTQLDHPTHFAELPEGWSRAKGGDAFDMMTDVRRYHVIPNRRDPLHPTFHHPHGFLLLDWQLQMHRALQFIRVCVGGYGSGKTLSVAVSMLYYAATLKGFVGFVLTPNANQASEVYTLMTKLIAGTKYEERFLIKKPTRPLPQLVIGHKGLDGVESVIKCMPIGDDPDKILTLTGDMALVDQSESLPVSRILRNVGSRFRGQLADRDMLGYINFVANSGDNPELWELYDEAESNPREVYAVSPGSHENKYLTIDDMIRFQRVVGTSETEHKMYLLGHRPIGDGEFFNRDSIAKCRDTDMLEMVKAAAERGDEGYVYNVAPKIGVHHFETPYDPMSAYLVIADPGWGNPPKRNAAAIGVFNIGSILGGDLFSFPNVPAQMVALHWVFGHNSPNPWLAAYNHLVIKYHAIGMNGFDATGIQSGYERLPTGLTALMPTPIPLTGVKKYTYLNLTRKMVADGKFRLPDVPHMFSQMSHYKLPDENIAQDLVMMLLCAGAMLETQWYRWLRASAEQDVDQSEMYEIYDRYDRSEIGDRYGTEITR